MKICTTLKLMSALLFVGVPNLQAQTVIEKLTVQNVVQPLTVEDAHPLFGWQMNSAEKGQKQIAYQVVVIRESDGKILWNSGKKNSGESQNIKYLGTSLQPETAYVWNLSVWDKDGKQYDESSRFETGLMNKTIYAWDGAQWIGSSENRLNAAAQSYFEISTKFKINKGNKMSLVVGANDFRFHDAFQNPESMNGEHYLRVELDFSNETTLNIYRVGYAPGDTADKPLYSVKKSSHPDTNLDELLPVSSKNEEHALEVYIEYGQIYFVIDGKDLIVEKPRNFGWGGFAVGHTSKKFPKGTKLTVSPYGSGGNYNTVPHLAEIGFAFEQGSEVTYTDYQVLDCGMSEDPVTFDSSHYNIFQNLEGVNVSGKTLKVNGTKSRLTVVTADPTHGALTQLRHAFKISKKVKSAKIYASAMGSYELYINGKRVGEDWFAPGDSQFRETLTYQAYDVTSLLQNGDNALAAQLNPGWFTGYMTFTSTNYNFFGDHEALLARLVVKYEDGTKDIIVSDPKTWKLYTDGPIRFGSFFQGETYDARKEAAVEGWKNAGYNDSSWKAPQVIGMRSWMHPEIQARYDELVQVRETLTAQKLGPSHSKDGHTYIYNMGVNMVGVPSISIPAGWLKEGDVVILRYAEQLYPGFKGDEKYYVETYGTKGKNIAGRPQYETMRAAFDTDFYVAKSSEAVTIQPSTTFRGYQYVQITIPSHKGALPLENVKGLVLSSDKLPQGTYVATTSDKNVTAKLVNQLIKNIQRSQLGNFFTIPTDCPQRNERMGWTGDAQAYTRTATYNSDVRNFFRQWMVALRADQGIGSETEAAGGIGSTVPTYNQADDDTFADGSTWSGAVCQVPWQLYQQYGDKQIIEENMEAMMAWLNGMDFYDQSEQYPHLSAKATGLADWLSMDRNTTSDLCNNAIYIHLMDVTAIMAEAIGKTDYAELLRERHDLALQEWNDCYVDPSTGKTRSADGKLIHSQTSYATPLNFNVFLPKYKAKAEQYLAELTANPSNSNDGKSMDFAPYTITTGFSGTPNMLPSLTRGGKWDDAYKLFTSTKFTSWLYPVTMGATSVWERWNGYEVAFGKDNQNSMNSFNHFALGAVGEWMYEYSLGITSGDAAKGQPGYKHFILQPTAGPLYTSLQGSYESNYGPITVKWTADGKGNMLTYEVTVPANTTATLFLPGESGKGDGYKGQEIHLGKATSHFEIQSGSYVFKCENGNWILK